MLLALPGAASAFFIDFENGTEGADIIDIIGVSFENYNGYNAKYGDSRIGGYNTTSDDLGYGSGAYHHNGNFWLWDGIAADARGVKIDFTENDGTWFQTGYSAAHTFYLEAYFTDGTSAFVNGASNTGGAMDYLTIVADAGKYIDYVVLHDSGNYWLADDMSGDASGIPYGTPEPATLILLGLGLAGIAGTKKALKK